MVKENSTQRKRRLEKKRQKRREKVERDKEAAMLAAVASMQDPQTLIAEPKGRKFNLVELPEMIIVETRFISQQAAIQAQIESAYTLEAPLKQQLESADVIQMVVPASLDTAHGQRPFQRPSPLQGTISMQTTSPLQGTFPIHTLSPLQTTRQSNEIVSYTVRKKTTDTYTLTDSANPSRDRAQQTETNANHLTTIGIQCNLEQEEFDAIFDNNNTNGCSENEVEKRNVKEQFLQFIMEKSELHGNGKYECLVCGEIKSNSRTINSHMALHWGPTALCSHCGLLFEHHLLLSRHRCAMKRSSEKKKYVPHLRCPHYRCRVTAISPLELYDHINEHSGQQIYQCCSCKHSFCTAGELRHHMTMRIECLEVFKLRNMPYSRFNSKYDSVYRLRVFTLHTAKRKRVLVKTFLSARTRNVNVIGRQCCQICLKYCSNAYKFSKHSAACRKHYLNRLNKKRNIVEATQTTLVNGNDGH